MEEDFQEEKAEKQKLGDRKIVENRKYMNYENY